MTRICVQPSNPQPLWKVFAINAGVLVIGAVLMIGNSLWLKSDTFEFLIIAAGISTLIGYTFVHINSYSFSRVASNLSADEVEYCVRNYERWKSNQKPTPPQVQDAVMQPDPVPVAPRQPALRPVQPAQPPQAQQPLQPAPAQPQAQQPLQPAPAQPQAAQQSVAHIAKQINKLDEEAARLNELWGESVNG